MNKDRDLAPYEKTLLEKFKKRFYQYVFEIWEKTRSKNIQEIFLGAICKLFDLEMAFIAEGKKKNLRVKYVSPEREAIKKEVLSLKEEIGSYDDLREANVKELKPLIDHGINSILFLPIETKGLEREYLFMCNRTTPAILDRLFTSYDLIFGRILSRYIFPPYQGLSREILDKKVYEGKFQREIERIITRMVSRYSEELEFKEEDISKELQTEDRDELKELLNEAEEKIDMWFMPIVSLINRQIFGYEMLARDVTEKEPEFPDNIFVRARTLRQNAINQLDYLCIRKVFDKIEKVFTQPEKNPSLQGKFFFINIYHNTVKYKPFKELLKEKSSVIMPWFVVFDIIDTELIKDYTKFRETLKESFLYGYHFADDDHSHKRGPGDERFHLKPNYIRIGEEFIKELLTDDGKQIIEGLVRGAFSFSGYVVAERIPTGDWTDDKIIKALQESGVFLGQGYMFGDAKKTPIIPSKELLSLEKALEEWIKAERRIDEFRKKMTFLIIDVAGSTEIKKGKDEKDIDYTFNKYHSYVEDITKEKVVWSGDGGICAFQSPDKSVEASIQIQEGLDNFNTDPDRNRLNKPIKVRIGINTGHLLVDPEREIGKWAGEVMDIAGHLQKYSEPGEIRIGEETYKKLKDKANFKEDKSIDGVKTYLYQK